MERPTYREPFDSPEHRLIEKYIRVTRLHRSMVEHQLEGTGVYRSQHQILMYVSRNPNVSQKELAGMYGVSGATIAVSLKKLERGGYISRLVDQNASLKRENGWWRTAFPFSGAWNFPCLRDFPRMTGRCWGNCWTGSMRIYSIYQMKERTIK